MPEPLPYRPAAPKTRAELEQQIRTAAERLIISCDAMHPSWFDAMYDDALDELNGGVALLRALINNQP